MRSPAPVLAVDSGGSGVRIAVSPAYGDGPVLTWSSPEPVPVGDRGIDARVLLDRILPAARRLLCRAGAERFAACCVGAAGMVTLGADLRAVLPGALRAELGIRRLALASDSVTAYAGALGQRPGVVVAAGTGLVALGTGLTPGGGWRRADGWGHLLGDCGGGAWIGRAGLEAALRAYDGRAGGSAALLGRLEAVFGPAPDLPGMLYPRPDRAAVLASFAPEVGRCAAVCPVAADILRRAARHIAEAAAAACPPADGGGRTGSGSAGRVESAERGEADASHGPDIRDETGTGERGGPHGPDSLGEAGTSETGGPRGSDRRGDARAVEADGRHRPDRRGGAGTGGADGPHNTDNWGDTGTVEADGLRGPGSRGDARTVEADGSRGPGSRGDAGTAEADGSRANARGGCGAVEADGPHGPGNRDGARTAEADTCHGPGSQGERVGEAWRRAPVMALTGGLAGIGPPLLLPLRQELRKQLPAVRQMTAAGSPLDGASRIAAALVTDRLLLPVDGSLLDVVSGAPSAASPGHTFG
ncbi:hypothetical protein H340_04949 [Streptomyces mobaraensis NBRC 13819 = DSM 40847]|uniref:ATPase BadF/BadG/BcrA/BcrD type domain-containing protein n=1 Tax=Streptomyces mobaraensis (strain ATCC 29032 / DSM 40847 / JCM 4168 / NBRC 13819 / NCIMB 11159 / IPCR 16-22) TaxID=1223523 RepID=M3CCC7_STRM1|nr:hypothetical protein H340_04949 [Streptomyces mobaraensis NBRC 13819 = DSM 40847]